MVFPPPVGPEVGPPPPEQTSSSGGGLQTVKLRLGPGWYTLYSGTITSDQGYAESAKLYVEYEHGDGSTSNVMLSVGEVSNARPFVANNLMFEGPGSLVAEVFLHETTTTFSFVANYRKVRI